MPDDELKFTEKYMRQINSEILPHLTALLYKSGYPIEYNNYQLQERKKGISTCGRWVGMRLFFRDLPIEDFIKIFIGNRIYNPDDIVTLLTYIILFFLFLLYIELIKFLNIIFAIKYIVYILWDICV